MIIDWVDNNNRIFKTKQLADEDASDRKISFRQEIVYIAFLVNEKKYTREQCFKEWRRLKNGQASHFADDKEQQQIAFDRVWNKVQDERAQARYTAKILPITIFKSEIDFINGLDAPLWMRQYWAALLFYYKFAIQFYPTVQKSTSLNAWCLRHTVYKKKNYGGNCQDLLSEKQRKLGNGIIQNNMPVGKDRYPTYVPLFLAADKSTDVVQTFARLNQIDEFLALIKPPSAICTMCGKEFTLSSYTKRQVCEECYKAYRTQYYAQKKRALRAREKTKNG